MTTTETLVSFLVAISLILVGYIIYLYPQRYLLNRARTPITLADQRIPFQPRWVWVYSGLFYPFWLSPILIISNVDQFSSICASFGTLLIAQLIIAHFYPVKTPDDWRQYNPNNSLSERFLYFVQRIDKGGNAFPSMHVAVTVLTTLHIVNIIDPQAHPEVMIAWAFPIFVAISTLYTKQHLIIDIPAGALLAVLTYNLHLSLPLLS